MADRRRTRYRVPLAIALLAAFGFPSCAHDDCENGTCVSQSGSRLIDRICRDALPSGQPSCETSGGAEQTSGISADTIGFQLTGQSATLTIHLVALDAVEFSSGTFDVEVLAATSDERASSRITANATWGSCMTACGTAPPPRIQSVHADYAWVKVMGGIPVPTSIVPDDAVLTLTGDGVDIADIRTTSAYDEGACSIASRPLGAR